VRSLRSAIQALAEQETEGFSVEEQSSYVLETV
jgi:hypothetical protein